MHIISLIFQCKVRDLVYVRMIFHLPKGKNLEERRVLKVVIMWTVQNDLCRPACHLAVISDGNWLSFPCRLVSPLLRNERAIFFHLRTLNWQDHWKWLSDTVWTAVSCRHDWMQFNVWLFSVMFLRILCWRGDNIWCTQTELTVIWFQHQFQYLPVREAIICSILKIPTLMWMYVTVSSEHHFTWHKSKNFGIVSLCHIFHSLLLLFLIKTLQSLVAHSFSVKLHPVLTEFSLARVATLRCVE